MRKCLGSQPTSSPLSRTEKMNVSNTRKCPALTTGCHRGGTCLLNIYTGGGRTHEDPSYGTTAGSLYCAHHTQGTSTMLVALQPNSVLSEYLVLKRRHFWEGLGEESTQPLDSHLPTNTFFNKGCARVHTRCGSQMYRGTLPTRKRPTP